MLNTIYFENQLSGFTRGLIHITLVLLNSLKDLFFKHFFRIRCAVRICYV